MNFTEIHAITTGNHSDIFLKISKDFHCQRSFYENFNIPTVYKIIQKNYDVIKMYGA